ncbi:nitroreductase [Allohahella sp. A8]|uniref:nitroreductase family protein n=1 Tax=Allohahella sp. A8 TaxID=3141461 RepID=UPI0026CC4512
MTDHATEISAAADAGRRFVAEFLHNRQSEPKLCEPAPSEAELRSILPAVCRSPDHGNLKPYRFIVLTGEAQKQLGTLFLKAETQDAGEAGLKEGKAEKILGKPLRAPMIIVGVARLDEQHKVPVIEQWLAAGCAVQTLSLLLENSGYGVMWRSGSFAYSEIVRQGLGLADNEQICAFLYCGTVEQHKQNRPALPSEDTLISFCDQL